MPGTSSRPFAGTSPWNTLVDLKVTRLLSPTSIENVEFQNRALGATWLQVEDMVEEPGGSARAATWTYDVFNDASAGGRFSSNGSLRLTTPHALDFVHGTDGWAVFFDPNGVNYYETWLGSYDAATATYHAGYLVKGDLNGTGFGIPNGAGAGVRASGASLLGGVVTKAELQSLSIKHALAIELSNEQLHAGRTQAEQYIYPAITADGDSVTSYHGHIPMGARFVIPREVNLKTAGLSPEGLALATAYQRYGGYVVDRAGATTSIAQIDIDTKTSATIASNLFKDMEWIRTKLVMVDPIQPSKIARADMIASFSSADGGSTGADTAHSGLAAGNAEIAYRLYEAAFDRAPDMPGLAFWTEKLTSGLSVRGAAEAFVASPEFESVYGPNPKAADLVEGFYANALGRTPDKAGFDFWVGLLDGHGERRAMVLEAIANSQEHQAAPIAAVGNTGLPPADFI